MAVINGKQGEFFRLPKDNLEDWVEHLLNRDEKLIGVRQEKKKYLYDQILRPEEVVLDFDVTVQSPKRYFLPEKETLVCFKNGPEFSAQGVNLFDPLIILGIHPYDLIAIAQMDKVFAADNRDENYLKKREQMTLIGVDIENPNEKSFAGSMGTAVAEQGYDIMLTDLGAAYLVEVKTEQGKKLISSNLFEDASDNDLTARKEKRDQLSSKFNRKLGFDPEKLPDLLSQSYHHPIWEEKAAKCFSCGSCNLVCPTCYCFDVQDEMKVNLAEGKRVRMWDGCLLEEFAEVAGGENFREERSQRYRHRFYRKGKYIHEHFGDIACVGCGRCTRACLPDIADPVEVYNTLKESQEE